MFGHLRSAQLKDVPPAIGEAGLFCDTERSGIAVAVQVDRDRAIIDDLSRGLGDEHASQALATVGGISADGYFVAALVVFLDADTCGILPVFIPGCKDIAIEWSEPIRKARILSRYPFADVWQGRRLGGVSKNSLSEVELRVAKEFRDRHVGVGGTEFILEFADIDLIELWEECRGEGQDGAKGGFDADHWYRLAVPAGFVPNWPLHQRKRFRRWPDTKPALEKAVEPFFDEFFINGLLYHVIVSLLVARALRTIRMIIT